MQRGWRALRALRSLAPPVERGAEWAAPWRVCSASRSFAAKLHPPTDKERQSRAPIRNIGISAHIDSGKTTLTERILYYTGRITDIHEVRGKDGVGAKMDSMELEREKGITIKSAATHCRWGDNVINIIDTPGHVDFTIEVERALRVLDGAVLVLCSVGGVQSQTITVDRQMRRYNVPRLCFINKCDRAGADPFRVIAQVREKLKLNAAAVQYPIGLQDQHQGVVDLVRMKAYGFEGPKGEQVVEVEWPAHLDEGIREARSALVEALGEVDEGIADKFLMEEEVGGEELAGAIRRGVLARSFAPVFMGSAYKNKGVQLLLNGVVDYLPNPLEVANTALDAQAGEAELTLPGSPSGPMVAYAFKLEESRFGQLTFMRMYSGTLTKGDTMLNVTTGKRVRASRLVRMHSDDMEDIDKAQAGDIVALFGVDCASGDTFTDGTVRYSMSSLFVPEPVMSLAITPKDRGSMTAFSKAINRFVREDPTFRVEFNEESSQTIIKGMGELHLEIYVERMRREYGADCIVGNPRVSYREALRQRSDFNYLHKKQSGGQGQFGRVIGYIEPLPEGHPTKFEFENGMVGNNIPPNFIPAIQKGFEEAVGMGHLVGHPVEGVRVVLLDGQSHPVDSSELAFKIAAANAFREAYAGAAPVILEPVMEVEVRTPAEFQGTVMSDLVKRKGVIVDSTQEADDCVLMVRVPLVEMFGYSTALRSITQGQAEFSMEYAQHSPVGSDVQADLIAKYQAAGGRAAQRGEAGVIAACE
ncbi:unnamed protein product [Pedinophyceae sp. YPF-701]|nr:unnamed protein product [Pedinophyceae sp. YPF-701]